MNRPSARVCQLCDQRDFERIADRDRRGGPLDTVICRSCGLVSHAEIPSREQLARFYGRHYREQYKGESSPSQRHVMRAAYSGQRIFRRLHRLVNRQQTLLEVGAGIGCTVHLFEQAGYRARGVEPHAGFQSFAACELSANVTRGFLEDLPRQSICDVALLIHVIEHFRSPREALQHLHALIRPEGLLYLECPNLGGPFAPRHKLFHFAHVYNFTPRTLIRLAARCGFRLEQRFPTPCDTELHLLLRRVEPFELPDDGQGYAEAMAAMARYNVLTYHLRPAYLRMRCNKLRRYLGEYLATRPAAPLPPPADALTLSEAAGARSI